MTEQQLNEHQQLIAAALDGELPDEAWEQVAQLLEQDTVFAAEWDRQEALQLALEALPDTSTSVELWPAISEDMPVPVPLWKQYEWYGLLGIAALFFSAKGLDQFALGLGSLTFRSFALILVIVTFWVLRENPFRLASDQELQLVDFSTESTAS